MPNIDYTQSAGGYTLNTPMPSFGGATAGGPGMNFSGLDSFYQQMAQRKAQEEERRRAEEQRRQNFQEKMQASGFNQNAEESRARMQAMQGDRANQQQLQDAAMSKQATGVGQSLTMDPRTGQWGSWTDPQEAERFNTGKVLAGRSALGPGRKDDWNISSLQYDPKGVASARERRNPLDPNGQPYDDEN